VSRGAGGFRSSGGGWRELEDEEEGGGGEGAISGNTAAWEGLTEGGPRPERERRFLGCLRVPLAAIYQAESMEGSFRVRHWPAGWLVGWLVGWLGFCTTGSPCSPSSWC